MLPIKTKKYLQPNVLIQIMQFIEGQEQIKF